MAYAWELALTKLTGQPLKIRFNSALNLAINVVCVRMDIVVRRKFNFESQEKKND